MKKFVFGTLIALMLVAAVATPVLADTTQSTTASVSVSEFCSISLAGSINFGTLNPGDENQPATSSPAVTITVGEETNINVDIGIKGETSSAIALTNWKYGTASDGSDRDSIPAAYTLVYSDKAASSVNNFYHWITVPDGTAAGTYTAIVYYKAIKTGGTF